jgi:hypothetical protein
VAGDEQNRPKQCVCTLGKSSFFRVFNILTNWFLIDLGSAYVLKA